MKLELSVSVPCTEMGLTTIYGCFNMLGLASSPVGMGTNTGTKINQEINLSGNAKITSSFDLLFFFTGSKVLTTYLGKQEEKQS